MDRKEMPKALRDYTPPAFADWLVELARRCMEARAQPGISTRETRSQPGDFASAKESKS